MEKRTRFLGVRKPTKQEKQEHGDCDLVFLRENGNGKEIKIFVDLPTKDYGYFQWGADTDVLGDNVDDIENYIENKTLSL